MEGDGPGMSPGGIYPSGRTVTCPECCNEFVTDPPPQAPCDECGYNDWGGA